MTHRLPYIKPSTEHNDFLIPSDSYCLASACAHKQPRPETTSCTFPFLAERRGSAVLVSAVHASDY
jgi:hypothetical protein